MSECICGMNPPENGNPDCERCELISGIAALKKALASILDFVPSDDHEGEPHCQCARHYRQSARKAIDEFHTVCRVDVD
jgi:hypothetical protein